MHPVNPWAILQDPPLLLDSLRVLGLVGAGFSHVGEIHYKPGPRFSELVRFKDAVPDLGAPGSPACHVSLLETMAAPTFLGASNAQPPSCPGCQERLADWRQQLLAWQASKERYQWSCSKCGRKAPVQDLLWDKTNGLARYSLDVWGILQDAAAPSEELVAALERETFETWRYFYYHF